MTAANPASELPEHDAAEVDGALDEQETPDAVDYSDLIAPLEDDDGLDDSAADDLGPGIEIESLEDGEPDEPREMAIDVGTLVRIETEEEASALDDASGPAELDLSDTLFDFTGPLEDDEPAQEDLGHLLEDILPTMGGEDDDETYGTGDAAALLDLEEDSIRAVREPWPLIQVELTRGPRYGVRIDEAGVLFAGHGIERWTRGGAREEIAASPSTLTGLAPTTYGLIVVTMTGEVMSLENGTLRQNTGWREALSIREAEAYDLTIAGGPDRVYLRTSTGHLAATEDGGRHWIPVELEGAVLAMTPTQPHYVVLKTGSGNVLLRGSPDGSFAPVAAAGAARWLGTGCLAAAEGSVVALSHGSRGVAFSVDYGKTFAGVPGLGAVTALAVGMLHGTAHVFAASYSASGNTAALYRVDTMTRDIRLLAEIHASDDEEDATVTSLAFDELERSLWAVGSFGVRVVTRPD